MSSIRTALFGFVLAVTLGVIAWAQGDQGGQQLSTFQLMTGTVLVVTPDGKVSRRSDVPPDMIGEITKDARPMTATMIVAMRYNAVYGTPDRPMPGGTMLSEAITRSPKR